MAELNGQGKWVQHWKGEFDRLINMEFVVTAITEIKGHWDKRKAIAETLADLAAADKRYRTAAANYVAKVYKLKKVKKDLPDGVQDEFLDMVREATESALSSEQRRCGRRSRKPMSFHQSRDPVIVSRSRYHWFGIALTLLPLAWFGCWWLGGSVDFRPWLQRIME